MIKRGTRGKTLKRVAWVLFPFFFFIFVSFVFAQTPGQDVAAQAERNRREAEQRKQELEKKPVKAPEIKIEEKKEEAPAGGTSFILKELLITGTTVFKPRDFAPDYRPYLNTQVTFKDLSAIVEKIKARYKKKGYLTTNAYLPEQEVKEGKVEIRVAEGKMGQLKIEGNRWFSSEAIARFFHIKKNELLNVNTLQRDILRLNLNSDLEIKAVLAPGEAPETSDIILKAKENFPGHAGLGIDNQGSRLVGKYRATTSIRSPNVSGRFDSFYLSALVGKSESGETLSYFIPLGTYGTKIGLDATYFETKLGKEFTSFDITGKTETVMPRISWELALTEDFQATAYLGMDIKSIIKKTGETVSSNDQLRMPTAGFNFIKNDSLGGGGQTLWTPRFTFSTSDFLGASSRNHPSSSRADTGGFFFKYGQILQRTQSMPFKSYISFSSQMQLASHTLPSSEEFQLGGANSVRGYPEGDYLADCGGVVNVDWVFPMYLFPERWKLKNSDTPLRYQIEPVLFADVGAGRLKKVLTGENKDRVLAGIGGGLRIHLGKNFYLRLEWAMPVGNRPTGNSGPSTFHLTFQSEM
jgi:hemolysin activation/secretion protein